MKAYKQSSGKQKVMDAEYINQPKEIFTEMFSHQKLAYIHRNPVVAGIVDKAEDYLCSSARDYYSTGKGLLDVVLL